MGVFLYSKGGVIFFPVRLCRVVWPASTELWVLANKILIIVILGKLLYLLGASPALRMLPGAC